MKYGRWLPLLFLLALVEYSCRELRKELPLEVKLTQIDSTDTIASVHLWGADASRTDTLVLGQDSLILLELDTTLYREVLIAHAQGYQAHYYRLVNGNWQEGVNTDSLTKQLDQAIDFYGWDVQGRYQTLSAFYPIYRTALVFAVPTTLASLTTSQVRQIQSTYPGDSVQFVYLIPHQSDSVVRRVLRQDSLSGIAFSDSIGLVSRVRSDYGLSREVLPVVFIIDSLGKISPYKLTH